MNVDFRLDGDLSSAIEPILVENGSVEDIGVVPNDFRTAGVVNDTQLVCEVFDGDSLCLGTSGEVEIGGCQCDDDTHSPCRCPNTRSEMSVKMGGFDWFDCEFKQRDT